ncbi:unnamed protein product [Ambrosiozyma monospora]|uniref:Unnamed protein product n=1 Tax=Ambrosiozyma monospora TaxID=43982 RepID=A0ACB5T457_AMBMO|nr:unnamed protein product [Ambrosiozyma monospora]
MIPTIVTLLQTTTILASIVDASSFASIATDSITVGKTITPDSSNNISSGSTIDLFQPIATESPPDVFSREQANISIADGVNNGKTAYQTNKFYVNMMLNEQNHPAYVYPYTFLFENSKYHGLAISHSNSSTFESDNDNGASASYSNDIIGSFIFSAKQLTSSNTKIEVTDMLSMSTLVTVTDGSDDNFIDFPLVEGMGFGSAIYNGDTLIPQLNSEVGIKSFAKVDVSDTDKMESNMVLPDLNSITLAHTTYTVIKPLTGLLFKLLQCHQVVLIPISIKLPECIH